MNCRRLLLTVLAAMIGSAAAKADIKETFRPVGDSLSVLMEERTTVKVPIKFKNIMKRGKVLDFYFTRETGDFPWRKEDIIWFRGRLKSLFPESYRKYGLGAIYCDRVKLDELQMEKLTDDGQPFSGRFRTKDVNSTVTPLVRNISRPEFKKGLDGRHIALWQSHGRYYDHITGMWKWQRPCLFQTCEDMFTQGFVLPFLVPMLENSGAVTILPRERDPQRNEVIADNDPCGEGTEEAGRITGKMRLEGKWEHHKTGFADRHAILTGLENPFHEGTSVKARCSSSKRNLSRAIWEMEVPEKGNYAVYVSYRSFPNSTERADYTLEHAGGRTEFLVNQKISGGTWVYLGTFPFRPGETARIILSNSGKSDEVISADAVRLGGGMGHIARRLKKDPDSVPEISGLPRYLEGARYAMQWYGTDTLVYSQNEQGHDYRDDFMSRGEWTRWLSGGSPVNRKYIPVGKKEPVGGLGIPLDLSFALHSDAGCFPNDSIVGTLAIYTLLCERSRKLPDGNDRMSCRELADIVQTQVIQDMRTFYDGQWNRRGTWDRSYSESRTPAVPALLLELLSHQNFEDMKYGLDPRFRFMVSRSIYKGMVKYLSNRYDVPYEIQPLPVRSAGISFVSDNEVKISWKETEDHLEKTAAPSYFRLYTRKGDGGFDNGRRLKNSELKEGERAADGSRTWSVTLPLKRGQITSWKITACNDGGESFPSEILCAGVPERERFHRILIINNFDRVSAPAWYDTPQFASFNDDVDSGVPYINDITFTGRQFQNVRNDVWTDDFNPGFGASYQDQVGTKVAGNTFDFPYLHGESIMKAGYAFCSASAGAFIESPAERWDDCTSADIICGKQISTMSGNRDRSTRYSVWTRELQHSLKEFTGKGKNLLVSGANIGKDIWSGIYPIAKDSTFTAESQQFVKETLGFSWMTGKGTRSGEVKKTYNAHLTSGFPEKIRFNNQIGEEIYSVESPDGIIPASDSASTICRYADTGIDAGISYQGKGYKTICLGFPIETVMDKASRDEIIRMTLDFFD